MSDFMRYFEQRYRFDKLGVSGRVVAMATAHHRVNYIHPFVDGNGRVSRLISHAMALQAGIGAHGLWSISRGRARGLEDAGEEHLERDGLMSDTAKGPVSLQFSTACADVLFPRLFGAQLAVSTR